MQKIRLAASMIVALFIVLFFAVDKVWVVSRCETCGYERDDVCVRVLRHSVFCKSSEHESVQQLVLRDLQCECHHSATSNEIKMSWWGGVLASSDSRNGIERLVADRSWYSDTVRQNVRDAPADAKAIACRQLAALCNANTLKEVVAGVSKEKSKMTDTD